LANFRNCKGTEKNNRFLEVPKNYAATRGYSFVLIGFLCLVTTFIAGCRQPAAEAPVKKGPYDVSFDSSGGGAAPDKMTWKSGAGLTLPDAGAMKKDALFFCGWAAGSDSGTYAASPYKPKKNVTLYAIWRDVQGIIDESKARMALAPKVIGNPAENSGDAQEINAVIAQLMTLLEGTTATRPINTGVAGETESYKIYDYPAIYKKSGELEALSADFSGEIIVESWFFQYIAPTTASPDPAQRAKLKTAGVYEIELAGAAGGHTWTRANKTATGGKGGYVKAEFDSSGNVDVDVRVGGQGQGLAHYNAETSTYTPVYTTTNLTTDYSAIVDGRTAESTQPGGYNGGGDGGASAVHTFTSAAGGGGATDLRLAGSTALTGASGDPRIAVAGGGGGAAETPNSFVSLAGGNAGGLSGAAGVGGHLPKGGTQTDGGVQPSNYCLAGTPGKGTNGTAGNSGGGYEGRAGGGGGWWGGGAVANNGGGKVSSGAGGSSYTGGSGALVPNTTVLTTAVNETSQGNVWSDGGARVSWKR
jgi:hypothetical protein